MEIKIFKVVNFIPKSTPTFIFVIKRNTVKNI